NLKDQGGRGRERGGLDLRRCPVPARAAAADTGRGLQAGFPEAAPRRRRQADPAPWAAVVARQGDDRVREAVARGRPDGGRAAAGEGAAEAGAPEAEAG